MKIIVKDENEKNELLRTCRYLHDFSVMFSKMRKRNVVKVIENFGNNTNKPKVERIKDFKNICGISLDFENFPILNLLVSLISVSESTIEEFIIIEEE